MLLGNIVNIDSPREGLERLLVTPSYLVYYLKEYFKVGTYTCKSKINQVQNKKYKYVNKFIFHYMYINRKVPLGAFNKLLYLKSVFECLNA